MRIPGSSTAVRSGSNPSARTAASAAPGDPATLHDVSAEARGGCEAAGNSDHAPSVTAAGGDPGTSCDAVAAVIHPTCRRSNAAGLASPDRNAALYVMFFGSMARTNVQYRTSCEGL